MMIIMTTTMTTMTTMIIRSVTISTHLTDRRTDHNFIIHHLLCTVNRLSTRATITSHIPTAIRCTGHCTRITVISCILLTMITTLDMAAVTMTVMALPISMAVTGPFTMAVILQFTTVGIGGQRDINMMTMTRITTMMTSTTIIMTVMARR